VQRNISSYWTSALRCRRVLLLPIGAFLLLVFGPAPLSAQISPGPLAKAHQSLSGTSQCASCHEFGAKAPTFRCLDCHKEIARLLSENRGYHAGLQMKNPNSKDCVRCHLEHNGEGFALIHWEKPKKDFDHKLTGYPLEGKHAAVACEKCHSPAHIAPDMRPLLKRRDLSQAFVGFSQQCVTCHEDVHKGQLGKNCESCHNVVDWKAAKQFDHSKTRYPLTGMHKEVKCEACHKPDIAGGPARFKDMKFATCTACHSDPHHGAFKQKCEDCHTTAGWKKVTPQFEFDHSKTKFPVLGAHAKVSCVACHVGGDFKKPLPFENCKDCHKDIHSGQFESRPKQGECSECHTVDAWKPSLFDVKAHATSKYPLEGKHFAVACAKCHIPAGKDTQYKVKFANCADCHKDVHDNQFAAPPLNNRCETCHSVADFHRSLYTIAMHRDTRFPLHGAHAAVPCASCHAAGKTHRADKVLPFRFSDTTCTACHADPHHGEFKDRMERKRPGGTPFGCEACHNSSSWIDVNGFDHSKTKFPLLGAHRTVQCGACHKTPVGSQEVRFKDTPGNCDSCHKDPHGGQFKDRGGKTLCESCHDTQRWVPSTFDHDRRTKLPLTGGHAHVKCEKCHALTKFIDGNPVIFYKPTPLGCEECHGGKVPSEPASK